MNTLLFCHYITNTVLAPVNILFYKHRIFLLFHWLNIANNQRDIYNTPSCIKSSCFGTIHKLQYLYIQYNQVHIDNTFPKVRLHSSNIKDSLFRQSCRPKLARHSKGNNLQSRNRIHFHCKVLRVCLSKGSKNIHHYI